MSMLLRSVESVDFESMTTEDAKNKMHREKVHPNESSTGGCVRRSRSSRSCWRKRSSGDRPTRQWGA